MVAAFRTIEIEPNSETAKLIVEASESAAVVKISGSHFRVERVLNTQALHPDDIWEGYDPRRAIDGMRAAAGSWSDIDGEALKADIRRWREEGSRERFEE